MGGDTDTRDVKEDKGGEGYRRGMEERWEVGGVHTRDGREERRWEGIQTQGMTREEREGGEVKKFNPF